MDHAEFLAAHLTRALKGPAWHGPALDELLTDVTATEATTRVADGVHTIAELVAHIGAWARIAEQRLLGATGAPTDAEDWPAASVTSDAEWTAALRAMREAHASLMRVVFKLEQEQLDERLAGRDHSAAVMLHGVVEHDAYHGGQIAVIKKMVRR